MGTTLPLSDISLFVTVVSVVVEALSETVFGAVYVVSLVEWTCYLQNLTYAQTVQCERQLFTG